MSGVNPSTRAERALQTRARMLDAARDLFIEPGYAATTMDQIAARAEVAVQTIYYSFGTKGQLLIAVLEYQASGQVSPEPVMQRAWIREALATDSPRHLLELLVENGTAIYRGVAPLTPALRAASGDPTVDAYWRATGEGRKAGMGRLMGRLADLDALAVPAERATDILFAIHGHDTYRTLVVESGWSDTDYAAWALDVLTEQLLRP